MPRKIIHGLCGLATSGLVLLCYVKMLINTGLWLRYCSYIFVILICGLALRIGLDKLYDYVLWYMQEQKVGHLLTLYNHPGCGLSSVQIFEHGVCLVRGKERLYLLPGEYAIYGNSHELFISSTKLAPQRMTLPITPLKFSLLKPILSM